MIDKNVVVPALVAEWSALDELLSALDSPRWAVPTALPGWSVQDNVSHIVGTECALAGQAPPPCAADVRGFSHVHNDIGVVNELWVEGLRQESPARVLERFREITASRRATLEAMTQADFDAPSWTPAGQRTYGRFMRIRLFDCWMHEQDIREALGIPGNDSGPCAQGALSEVVDALGYLVGKRAGAPNGASVTFELTGPAHATWHVAVDGRAAVVDALPGSATTTVRLSSNLFARLAGGRVLVADRIGEVTVEGDTDLGTRVVHALPFTI
ncbi:maleylpyruvate isomerase family mycothiol-dependent enzyme [Actinophytocola sp.]|uniref:maleylpyruvate isomerase family mycothiol-dependent enzyme n=1 Tax=Actinophytocola sp. TaxID=1872138 RepID=UPI003D6A8F9A